MPCGLNLFQYRYINCRSFRQSQLRKLKKCFLLKFNNTIFFKVFKPEDDKEKVTAVSDKVPLSDIALRLNRFEGAIANWEKFALHEMIGVAKNKGELHHFGSPLLEDPTAHLFQLLEKKSPQLQLGELYDVLMSDSVKRVSTAKRLIDPEGMCYVPMMKLFNRLKTVILKLDTHYCENQTGLIFIKALIWQPGHNKYELLRIKTEGLTDTRFHFYFFLCI